MARQFQLELEMSEYSWGNKSIQEFYSGFVNLWTEFVELVNITIPNNSLSALQKFYKESQRDQYETAEIIHKNMLISHVLPFLI